MCQERCENEACESCGTLAHKENVTSVNANCAESYTVNPAKVLLAGGKYSWKKYVGHRRRVIPDYIYDQEIQNIKDPMFSYPNAIGSEVPKILSDKEFAEKRNRNRRKYLAKDHYEYMQLQVIRVNGSYQNM